MEPNVGGLRQDGVGRGRGTSMNRGGSARGRGRGGVPVAHSNVPYQRRPKSLTPHGPLQLSLTVLSREDEPERLVSSVPPRVRSFTSPQIVNKQGKASGVEGKTTVKIVPDITIPPQPQAVQGGQGRGGGGGKKPTNGMTRGALGGGSGRGGGGRGGAQVPLHPLVKHHQFVVPVNQSQQPPEKPSSPTPTPAPASAPQPGASGVWEYTDSQGYWIKFDPENNQKLEKYFQLGIPTTVLPTGTVHYYAEKMYQQNDKGQTRQIRRDGKRSYDEKYGTSSTNTTTNTTPSTPISVAPNTPGTAQQRPQMLPQQCSPQGPRQQLNWINSQPGMSRPAQGQAGQGQPGQLRSPQQGSLRPRMISSGAQGGLGKMGIKSQQAQPQVQPQLQLQSPVQSPQLPKTSQQLGQGQRLQQQPPTQVQPQHPIPKVELQKQEPASKPLPPPRPPKPKRVQSQPSEEKREPKTVLVTYNDINKKFQTTTETLDDLKAQITSTFGLNSIDFRDFDVFVLLEDSDSLQQKSKLKIVPIMSQEPTQPKFRPTSRWGFSPDLMSRPDWQDIGNEEMSYKSLLIKDGDKIIVEDEWQSLISTFPLDPAEIDGAYAISNERLLVQFENYYIHLKDRWRTSPAIFKRSDWQEKDWIEWRKWVLDELHGYADTRAWNKEAGDKSPKVVPMLQGTTSKAVWKVCQTGFAVTCISDDGWFGRGIYFTSVPTYAKYYTNGENVLILTMVNMGNPYPAAEQPLDKDSLSPRSKVTYQQELETTLWGKPCVKGYQSHYTLVNGDGAGFGLPYDPGWSQSIYDELIVFSDAQALPRYVVYLKNTGPSVTATTTAPPQTRMPRGGPGIGSIPGPGRLPENALTSESSIAITEAEGQANPTKYNHNEYNTEQNSEYSGESAINGEYNGEYSEYYAEETGYINHVGEYNGEYRNYGEEEEGKYLYNQGTEADDGEYQEPQNGNHLL